MIKKKINLRHYLKSTKFFTHDLPFISSLIILIGLIINQSVNNQYGKAFPVYWFGFIWLGVNMIGAIIGIFRREFYRTGRPSIKGIWAIIFGTIILLLGAILFTIGIHYYPRE